jgi:hypothetical protein
MNTDPDPDIVEIIIAACRQNGLGIDAAHMIEQSVREQFGGLRVRIPKRKKHPTPQERELILADGMTSMSTDDVTAKHKISRATLYRLMKRGSV